MGAVLCICADARGALLCYEALAELQVFMGERGAARATIAAALRSRQPNARFLRVAGLIEKRIGDLDAAAGLLKRSVAVDPRDYKSWLAVRMQRCCSLSIRMDIICWHGSLIPVQVTPFNHASYQDAHFVRQAGLTACVRVPIRHCLAGRCIHMHSLLAC
jgi:hypothetical protein